MTTTTPTPPAVVASPEDLRRVLGYNLVAIRTLLGLSQNDVARRIGGGMNQPKISGYEKGRNWPRPEHLAALAAALETTPARLLEIPPPLPKPFPHPFSPEGGGC